MNSVYGVDGRGMGHSGDLVMNGEEKARNQIGSVENIGATDYLKVNNSMIDSKADHNNGEVVHATETNVMNVINGAQNVVRTEVYKDCDRIDLEYVADDRKLQDSGSKFKAVSKDSRLHSTVQENMQNLCQDTGRVSERDKFQSVNEDERPVPQTGDPKEKLDSGVVSSASSHILELGKEGNTNKRARKVNDENDSFSGFGLGTNINGTNSHLNGTTSRSVHHDMSRELFQESSDVDMTRGNQVRDINQSPYLFSGRSGQPFAGSSNTVRRCIDRDYDAPAFDDDLNDPWSGAVLKSKEERSKRPRLDQSVERKKSERSLASPNISDSPTSIRSVVRKRGSLNGLAFTSRQTNGRSTAQLISPRIPASHQGTVNISSDKVKTLLFGENAKQEIRKALLTVRNRQEAKMQCEKWRREQGYQRYNSSTKVRLLEAMGTRKYDAYLVANSRLIDMLKSKIVQTQPEILRKLLDESFQYFTVPDLRLIPLAVMDTLGTDVPRRIIEEITRLGAERPALDVRKDLPLCVKQKVWERDVHAFRSDIKDLVHGVLLNASVHGIVTSFEALHDDKVVVEDAEVAKIEQLHSFISGSRTLILKMRDYLFEMFQERKNIAYCQLFFELIVLKPRNPSPGVQIQDVLSYACVRSAVLLQEQCQSAEGRITEMDVIVKLNDFVERAFGEGAIAIKEVLMILASVKANYLLCNCLLGMVLEMAGREQFRGDELEDDTEFKFVWGLNHFSWRSLEICELVEKSAEDLMTVNRILWTKDALDDLGFAYVLIDLSKAHERCRRSREGKQPADDMFLGFSNYIASHGLKSDTGRRLCVAYGREALLHKKHDALVNMLPFLLKIVENHMISLSIAPATNERGQLRDLTIAKFLVRAAILNESNFNSVYTNEIMRTNY